MPDSQPSGEDDSPRYVVPPPPPPPPPENPHFKTSKFILKLRTAPPGWFYQAPNPPPMVDLFAARTGPYFFYGSLMDTSLLAEILGLKDEPVLRPAYIIGYDCKLWGQYPALLDGAQGSIIEGAVYDVNTVEDGEKLAEYETRNYKTESCLIKYMDGKQPSQDMGYTFKFVGNRNDLSEGSFDLKVWLKRMGREAAIEKLEARKNLLGDETEGSLFQTGSRESKEKEQLDKETERIESNSR